MAHQHSNAAAYLEVARPLLGRVFSGIDAEFTSPSRGSFDRTWWCWKFTDFSAARFQEGAYTLAWAAASSLSPVPLQHRRSFADLAVTALQFWATLQHKDGSFDEAYPFERSLAATAFTGFYLSAAVERLQTDLSLEVPGAVLQALERAGYWLAANGEYHGVLSNHLAAAAAALQVIGDVLGTSRFEAARDRYLRIIYANQHPTEGWLREYGGADPGYQSHAMFYMAEIERRIRDEELLDRLRRASDFIAWFAHPDGTLGGEYSSRGTKFAYPAAFEFLASRVPSAAAVAAHLRERLSVGRGVSAREMDAWNQFPMLNNVLFAADTAGPLDAPPLPWQQDRASALFPDAGLLVARRSSRVVVAGAQMGGTTKIFGIDGQLVYEDCGYAARIGTSFAISQGESVSHLSQRQDQSVLMSVDATFRTIPTARFTPFRFIGFRAFTTSVGRLPAAARWLKKLLVAVLISRKRPLPGRLRRTISVEADGCVRIHDTITGLAEEPLAIQRQVPFHMGSSRYADLLDWCGPTLRCPQPEVTQDGYGREVLIPIEGPALIARGKFYDAATACEPDQRLQ